jgi:branched-chain amino acid transport system substrate-binding protein
MRPAKEAGARFRFNLIETRSKASVGATAIAAITAAGLLVGFTGESTAQAIKVGVVVPITSVLAPYGTPFVESMNMAVEAANAAGGINGRKLELVVEDSQASNTVAINALNKVLGSNPVAVFGAALGTQVLAMMPITEREKVPLIAGPSTRRVTQQGAKYYFRNSTHDAIDKETWTRFLVDDLGKKRIGILHVANEWGYSGRDNTAMFLDKLYGLKPVSIASYQPTDKDLTAQILQMGRDGADAIVAQGHPIDEALLVKQMIQHGVKVPHIGSGTLCIAFLRELVSPAEVAGRYCEGPDVMPPFNERPQVQAFVDAYKKRTGYLPDIYATHYYDATGMLIAVMKKYGVDREKIRQGFREMAYEGIIGAYKTDEEGNLWHNAVVMEFLPEGKIKIVRRYKQ